MQVKHKNNTRLPINMLQLLCDIGTFQHNYIKHSINIKKEKKKKQRLKTQEKKECDIKLPKNVMYP